MSQRTHYEQFCREFAAERQLQPRGAVSGKQEDVPPNASGGPNQSQNRGGVGLAWAWGAIVLAVSLLVVTRGSCQKPETLGVPPELLDNAGRFPRDRGLLPPSAPLAPLLAADEPERFAIIEPSEGAVNLRRLASLVIRFNRPVVEGVTVGRELEQSPLSFQPKVDGVTQWTTRSSLSFRPAADTWRRTRSVKMTMTPSLRSLAGEQLEQPNPVTVVFDASPTFVRHEVPSRLPPGKPIPLLFHGNPGPELARSILAYEVGGGQRSLGFTLTPGRRDEEGRRAMALHLGQRLEPGANIALALAPALVGGGGDPWVVNVELTPEPKIEGIDCSRTATEASACRYRRAPGRIVDIDDALVLLSNAELAPLEDGAVQIKPELPKLSLSQEEERRIVVRGDWQPDQVYEVRFAALQAASGQRFKQPRPLAVRSRTRSASVRLTEGRWTIESDDQPTLDFAAIFPEKGQVRHVALLPGFEATALEQLGAWFSEANKPLWNEEPLARLVPAARANRWGRGQFTLPRRRAGGTARAALVSFVPDATASKAERTKTAYYQWTDLGIHARALSTGVLSWVTSISKAHPISGAVVTAATSEGEALARVATNRDGLAWLPLPADQFTKNTVVQALHGADHAALLLDPRKALSANTFDLAAEDAGHTGTIAASVIADRGAVRRGERVYLKVVARRLEDATLTALANTKLRIEVEAPDTAAPVLQREVQTGAFGTASLDLSLDESQPLGRYLAKVFTAGSEEAIGQTEFILGDFRQPTLRVDLTSDASHPLDGDEMTAQVAAEYLFGAPAANLQANWSLVRRPHGRYPTRWGEFSFEPENAHTLSGTIDAGHVTLDAKGRASIASRFALSAPIREEATLELSVVDSSGETMSARHEFELRPARFEVGLKRIPRWLEHASTINVDAILIQQSGAPVSGRNLEVRIIREGWDRYWEWAKATGRDVDPDGTYQLRQTQRQDVVHRCALETGDAPVRCSFTPERPGNYVLEVSSRDDEKRLSLASQRVYVAGPDEHPDRDPPGTVIQLTPKADAWQVGETAEIVYESPFPVAEALVTVERDKVLLNQRKRVRAGGQVIRFPITAKMVPNAYVSLTLVRPRTGPPRDKIDLDAPDLRLGMLNLPVRPQASELAVTLTLPKGQVRTGAKVPIGVRVLDGTGKPSPAEVLLYAVDEGTLRPDVVHDAESHRRTVSTSRRHLPLGLA